MSSSTTSPLFGVVAALEALALPNTESGDLYRGFFAEFYGRMADGFSGDLAWFARQLGEHDARVLELCCGSGRLVALLASDGHQVTGVDIAPDMLAIAERRLAQLPAGIAARCELIPADMHELALPGEFDAVLLSGQTVSMFADRTDRDGIYAVAAKHVRPGGLLLFDYLPLVTDESEVVERQHVLPVGRARADGFVLVTTQRNAAERCQLANFYAERVRETGVTERFVAANRLTMLGIEELHAELRPHGFRCYIEESFSPAELLAAELGLDAAALTGDADAADSKLGFIGFRKESTGQR